MAEIVGFPEAFAAALAEVAVVLDERARRLLLGAAARQLGRGGIKLIAAATGAAADTVGKGAAELEAGIVAEGRVRARGAGRKPAEQTDPELWPALDRLVDPETRGDPMSRLRWTTKSTVKLAEELTAQANPGASSSSIFLKTMSSLSRNAQTTARVTNAAAPVVGRYLAVLVDPAIKAIKMARDDESHSAREYFVEMTKSTVVGAVKTGASASLGPLGGLAASMVIDKVAERLDDYITST